MAVPSNVRSLRGAPLKGGIILGISPSSDPTFDVEIARATSSGVYTTIARLTPQGAGMPVTYADILPFDGYTRSYKARAAKEGWLEGDYTSPVSAKPLKMPEILPNITPLTGKAIGATLYISTGTPAKVGSPTVTAYVTKTLRVAGSAFAPKNNTIGYTYGDEGSLQASSLSGSTAYRFQTRFAVPTGATVTGARVGYTRNSTGSLFAVQVRSVSTDGTATQRWQKASTATGGAVAVLQSSTFSFSVQTDYAIMEARISPAGAVGNVGLYFAELTYQVQTYVDTL